MRTYLSPRQWSLDRSQWGQSLVSIRDIQWLPNQYNRRDEQREIDLPCWIGMLHSISGWSSSSPPASCIYLCVPSQVGGGCGTDRGRSWPDVHVHSILSPDRTLFKNTKVPWFTVMWTRQHFTYIIQPLFEINRRIRHFFENFYKLFKKSQEFLNNLWRVLDEFLRILKEVFNSPILNSWKNFRAANSIATKWPMEFFVIISCNYRHSRKISLTRMLHSAAVQLGI